MFFTTHWISAPATWKITTVQAGVTVLIAVLCTVGIFVFSRFCWQLSGRHLARNEHVSLSSLISINTIGEACDAFFLLRHRIFHPRYWRILSQSVVVTLLTVATILSGIVAKASTQVGVTIYQVPTTGLLANRDFNSLSNAYVAWNQTATSLDHAGFPYDQLLDYMPDPSIPWVYNPSEWNSSWTMQCNQTVDQQATFFDTGNCTDVFTELSGMDDVFPERNFTESWRSFSGLNNGSIWSNVLFIMGGWTWPGFDDTTDVILNMTVSFAAFRLQGLAFANTTSTSKGCLFGYGPVQSTYFDLVQCELTRTDTIPNSYDVAYPDHGDRGSLVDAYVSNYIARLAKESVTGASITGVTAEELIRFYQVYLAVKDTNLQMPVIRPISVRRSVVQISDTFIGIICVLALLDLVGVLYYLWFMIAHWNIVLETPESKLDWAVQSIMGSGTPTQNQTPGKSPGPRWSVVAVPADEVLHHRKSDKMRAYFENARYGDSGVEEVIPLQSDMSTPGTAPLPPSEDYSVPAQFMYNISPYEAQFASQDTSYGHGHGHGHGYMRNDSHGLGLQPLQQSIYSPPQRGRYQRLS